MGGMPNSNGKCCVPTIPARESPIFEPSLRASSGGRTGSDLKPEAAAIVAYPVNACSTAAFRSS